MVAVKHNTRNTNNSWRYGHVERGNSGFLSVCDSGRIETDTNKFQSFPLPLCIVHVFQSSFCALVCSTIQDMAGRQILRRGDLHGQFDCVSFPLPLVLATNLN